MRGAGWFLAGLAALAAGSGAAGAAPTPAFEAVRAAHLSSEAQLLDRHGEVLHTLRVDDQVRRLPWVPLEAVSPALLQAVVRAEDRRFHEHHGVDWRALGDAALDTVLRGAPRGASTLTMQVASLVDPALRAQGARRTVLQKIAQIRAARALEGVWSKRQILEAHLNLSTFRGELSGVGAAAQGLFGKAPSGLDAREAALLAALLRGPNADAAVVARRACTLVESADCAAVGALAAAVLTRPPRIEGGPALAAHVARALLSSTARRVVTTLDARLQARVLEILQRQLARLEGRGVADAAALVVDNDSGAVLAYAGNQGVGSSAPFVDGVRALRQAGSTLKPFLYAQAIEERLLTAASLLDDSPAHLSTPSGQYVPQNYDREFRGPVSVRAALSGSLNVPAVRALALVGTERFVQRLRALGFASVDEEGDWYGFALALGGAEVSLWDMAGAYRTLARGGRGGPLTLLPGARRAGEAVLSPEAAWIVTDILSDRGARSASFGLENPLSTRAWSAVKTGTSKDMRDNWCAGFTRRHTVVVWVGNFDGSPMRDVSGVSGAAPAWAEIVQLLSRGDSGAPPPRPPGVEVQSVRFQPPLEPPRDEVFVRGTAQPLVQLAPAVEGVARIAYPGEGAVLALDPDIPPEVQRVRFLPSAAAAGLSWRLDQSALGADPDGSLLWPPVAGRHQLELLGADGQVRHAVRFEVRGLGTMVPGP